MGEPAKVYDPKSVEKEVYERWIATGAFNAEPGAPGAKYCIVIPPPNVTAALHLGHALNNTLQDVLIRVRRMQGYNALWMPGTDHAGIATQTVVDKRLKAEGQPDLTAYRQMEADGKDGRRQFVSKVQAWKDEYEQRILTQLKTMGCSCDWRRTRFTMDEVCAKAVRATFFKLFSDGLIYRGKRLVNWDPATQTVLADDEVEHEEINGHFYYLKYPLAAATVVDGKTLTHITVATTRPETMLGDTAVAMNPADPRAKYLVGKMVRLPIVGRLIPIIADEHVVLPNPDSDDAKAKVSTGFLKVTPAHDPDDYAIRQRHPEIAMINILAPDGTISEKHGWTDWDEVKNPDVEKFVGMDRFEARKAIMSWLREEELVEKVIDYVHQVGHSYRSHVPIEPYLSDQWYVAVKKPISNCQFQIANLTAEQQALVEEKDGVTYIKDTDVPVNSLAGLALMPLLDGRLKFTPDRYANNYRTWLENLRDWPISRQLWWGHQIPVWHASLRYSNVWEPGVGYRDGWTPEACYADFEKAFQEFATAAKITGEYCLISDPRMPGTVVFICSKTPHADSRLQHLKEVFKNCDPAELISSGQTRLTLNSQEDIKASVLANKIISIEQDPDVLDTWFSSALWPFSTLGWPEATDSLAKWYPGDVLCTAREIITLWVSRMVMMGQYCVGDIPFSDVFIHAMIQDGEGRKMSKSLGNGIDPLDIIDSHGADAMRFTLVSMTTQTQDVRMPVEKMTLPDGREMNTSPKFDVGRNFANKLWNASRFAMMNLAGMPTWAEVSTSANLADQWIVSRLHQTIRDATASVDGFRYNELADTLYHFMWDDLCDWYLEIAKGRINAGQTQPKAIVAYCLDSLLRLLQPIMPFITEAIWTQLNEVAPNRGPTDAPAEKMLINAAWPRAESAWINPKAEADFGSLREIIRGIRNVRTQHNVPPSKKVGVIVQAAGAAQTLLRDNVELMKSQANLESVTFQAGGGEVPAGASAVAVGDVKLYVLDIIDRGAELARLTKQAETLRRGVAGIEGKLGNEGFVAKAPPAVVAKERQRLEALKAELAAVEHSLAALK